MTKSKSYYLSDDIYPEDWESVSDAYNDLAVYAYNHIKYLSGTYPIPEEYVGDAVLKACEKAFKYSYSYDEGLGKLHNWFNLILKNVLHDIYNRLPKEQSLDNILNVRHGSPAYDDQCDDPDAEETSEGDTVGMGTSPEHNMVHDEVKKIRKEIADALKNHVDNLRPIDRDIFIKAYIDGVPFKKIAAQFGMTETGARKRAFDIRKRIRNVVPDITSWNISDMVLYCMTTEPIAIPPAIYPMQHTLLDLYPQYDTREINWYENEDLDLERELDVHLLLSRYLEMCFDEYKQHSPEGHETSEGYAELVSELQARGRTVTEKTCTESNICIIEDDLDIVISGNHTLMIFIGFVHEFIQIMCAGADAKSVADFIDDLHMLIDRAGEEIDSIIDIRI